MVRALLADADLVNKTTAGLQPRPCVYCNVCWEYIHTGRQVACMYGPSTGRETEVVLRTTRECRSQDVHVVGGGPAGMEFARVAAELGHQVTLHEGTSQLGGRLLVDAGGSGRGAIKEAVVWFEEELDRLGVRVVLGEEVDFASLQSQPGLVVVATGALPVITPVPGAGAVISLEEAQANAESLTGPVVIVDEVESEPVYATAELIARAGKRVSIVTRRASIGRHVAYVDIIGILRRLDELDVDIHPMVVPIRVDGDHLVVRHALSGKERDLGEVHTVVQAGPYRAPEIDVDSMDVLIIGDASAPREVLAVVREASDLAYRHLG
jgi:NADPH-dependent 2,4-dienoyl-CoA reductase/sulfur reductase-like enzyme